jgi:hypothetical protein
MDGSSSTTVPMESRWASRSRRRSPLAMPLERLNTLLAELGEAPLPEQDYLPLRPA